MSANSSWLLRKPNAVISRRTLMLQNITTDSNSTIPNESENVFKPPKRKSCMVGKERKILKMPEEKKSGRPSMIAPPNGGFKTRTLKIIETTRAVAPPPPSIAATTRCASLIPGPGIPRRQKDSRTTRPFPTAKSTPLHMSTPCEPISILKSSNRVVVPAKIKSATKRVNFDAIEPAPMMAVEPFDESTIEKFNFNIPKVSRTITVDASTNTEESSNSLSLLEMQQNILAEVRKMFSENDKMMLERDKMLLEKIEEKLMERSSSCSCNCTPKQPDSVTKALVLRKFASNLEDIREVSENVTPTFEESQTPGVSSSGAAENETPLGVLEGSKPEILAITQTQEVTPLTPPLEKDDECVTTNKVESPNSEGVDESNAEIETVIIGKSPKRKRTRRKLSPHVMAEVRTRRKRSMPKYFQSFDIEMSPRPKSSKIY